MTHNNSFNLLNYTPNSIKKIIGGLGIIAATALPGFAAEQQTVMPGQSVPVDLTQSYDVTNLGHNPLSNTAVLEISKLDPVTFDPVELDTLEVGVNSTNNSILGLTVNDVSATDGTVYFTPGAELAKEVTPTGWNEYTFNTMGSTVNTIDGKTLSFIDGSDELNQATLKLNGVDYIGTEGTSVVTPENDSLYLKNVFFHPGTTNTFTKVLYKPGKVEEPNTVNLTPGMDTIYTANIADQPLEVKLNNYYTNTNEIPPISTIMLNAGLPNQELIIGEIGKPISAHNSNLYDIMFTEDGKFKFIADQGLDVVNPNRQIFVGNETKQIGENTLTLDNVTIEPITGKNTVVASDNAGTQYVLPSQVTRDGETPLFNIVHNGSFVSADGLYKVADLTVTKNPVSIVQNTQKLIQDGYGLKGNNLILPSGDYNIQMINPNGRITGSYDGKVDGVMSINGLTENMAKGFNIMKVIDKNSNNSYVFKHILN